MYTGKEAIDDTHFSSKQKIIFEGTGLEETYEKILGSLATFQRNGSNWGFGKMKKVELYISRYRLIGGSSYIPLSPFLKNDDEECFKWSVARAEYINF